MLGIHKFANENFVYLVFGVFALIILFYFVLQWKQKKMQEFAHVKSVQKIFDSVSSVKRIVKYGLLVAVYLLVCVGIMRPQGLPKDVPDQESKENKEVSGDLSQSNDDPDKNQKVKVKEASRDIIFLLDVSGSMGAEDLTPNRLEKAKDYITDIVDALEGEHVGLVIFTSRPSVKCVLTLDYTYFKQVLRTVTINDNDYAGTKFLPALDEILNKQFDYSENKNKELFIITDGGDTDLEGLKGEEQKRFREQILELAKKGYEENKIRIHTVGLGTAKGAVIPGVKDADGNYVKSALDGEFLKSLSQAAGGIYIAAEDGDPDMKGYYQKYVASVNFANKEKEIEVDQETLNDMVLKAKEEQEGKIIYTELFWIPSLLAFLLLFTEYFISEKKKMRQ